MTTRTLPAITGNGFIAFPTSLLKASASLLNIFSKPIDLLVEDHPEHAGSPPSSNTIMAHTNVEMVIERVESIDTIVAILR